MVIKKMPLKQVRTWRTKNTPGKKLKYSQRTRKWNPNNSTLWRNVNHEEHKLCINLIQNTQCFNANPVCFLSCKSSKFNTFNKLSMDMRHNSVNFCWVTWLNREYSLKICLLPQWWQNSTINRSGKLSVISKPNDYRI